MFRIPIFFHAHLQVEFGMEVVPSENTHMAFESLDQKHLAKLSIVATIHCKTEGKLNSYKLQVYTGHIG